MNKEAKKPFMEEITLGTYITLKPARTAHYVIPESSDVRTPEYLAAISLTEQKVLREKLGLPPLNNTRHLPETPNRLK